MPTFPTVLTFAVAATLLIIVPGPNVLYIVTRGMTQGRKAALASAFGVEVGLLAHIGAAALGLSAVVASSGTIFSLVKYGGALYLVWMGIAAIRSRAEPMQSGGDAQAVRLERLFLQGTVINVLNPKVGLFFLAFLPQFIERERGNATAQVFVLGLVFFLIALLSDGLYAIASGSIGRWLESREAISRQRNRFSGVVYLLLGGLAALTGSNSTT